MGPLLVCLALTLPPLVSSRVDSGVTVVSGAVEMRSLSLLGVDVERGLVGIKVVSTAKPYGEMDDSSLEERRFEPTRCRYAGMNKTPFDGVMLALLRAGADDEASWVVYEPAYEAARCTAPAVSKARLTDAKAAFAKARIPMDRSVEFTAMPDAQGQMSLKIGERTVVVRTTEKDEDCDAENHPTKVKASGCDGATDRIRTVTFSADGQPFYESWSSYTGAYGGRAESKVLGAFVSGTKVLFLLRFTTLSDMKGLSSAETVLSVSPVLDLAR